MIDEGSLADPTRCPSCGSPLDAGPVCPSCGLPLRGEAAQRVWALSLEAAEVLGRRRALLDQLRTSATAAAGRAGAWPAQPGTVAAPGPPVIPGQGAWPGPEGGGAGAGGGGWTPPPARPRPEWTRHRVQNLLLALGVLLLGVAAVIFVVVSWGRLGVGPRTALLAAVTGLAAGATRLAARRALTASSEALAVLTTLLVLLDALGLRRAGVLGLDRPDGGPYWAGVAAVVAALAVLGTRAVGTRTLPVVAVLAGLAPALLLGGHLASEPAEDHPAAWVGLGALVDTGLILAALRPARVTAARVAALGLLVPATFLALVLAAADGLGSPDAPVPGAALLVALAAVGAAADRWARPAELARTAWAAGTGALVTVAVLLAAWTLMGAALQDRDSLPAGFASVVAVLALALLGLVRALPFGPARSLAAAGVLGLAATGTALSVLAGLLTAAAAPLDRLDRAWEASNSAGSRDVLDAAWTGGRTVPLTAALSAVALVALGFVVRRLLVPAVWLGLGLTVLAVASIGPALDLPLVAATAIDVAAALALLVAGYVLLAARRGDVELIPKVGAGGVAAGLVLAVIATGWALAADAVTVATLPVVAVATGLLALAPRLLAAPAVPAPRMLALVHVVLAAASAAAGLASVAAATRYGGAGWPAVWSTTGAVALPMVTLAAVALPVRQRPAWAAAVVAVAGAEASALAWWAGASLAGRGLAAVVVGSLLAVAAVHVPALARDRALRATGALTATVVAIAGLAFSGDDADLLWIALLAAGVAAAAVAVRPDLRELRWVALALLTASSWVRLASADVDAPEAYTVPPAVALLALSWWQRRQAPTTRSWPAYGPGLALALGPSLERALTDPGTTRPLLLGLTAVVVLLVGVARRLQAPLVIGAVVLAVDALVQLSPYLADAYSAVPRWVSIGAVGLLLLGLGATFEQRLHDVRGVRERFAGLR